MQYLASCTPLDIAFAAVRIARFTGKPRTQHMELFTHIMKYLQRKIHHGIQFARSWESKIIFFAGADYAESTDRKSTSSTIHIALDVPIAWTPKKLASFALSTSKAEYVAENVALKEALWLR